MVSHSSRTQNFPWRDLQGPLRGTLLLPVDAGYDEARRVWNGAIDRRPLAIACCRDAEDVGAAVKFALRERVPMTVRGGGHNVAGLAVRDDALMLDLRSLNRVEVDPRSRTARVEGGALWRDVDAASQPHGLATTGGFVSTTGVGGYTLGGGVGWLMRRCGLAIDNLLKAEVVLADGSIVTASEDQHADLFWGLRGGGAGLGVVTRFAFRLHPVSEVHAGIVFYPIEAGPALLRAFRVFTPDAADALTVMLVFTTAPPLPFLPPEAHGRRAVALAYCWNGDPGHGAQAAASIAQAAEPLGRHEGRMPYVAWQQMFDPAAPAGHHYYWTTSLFDAFDDGLIEALVPRAVQPADALCEVHVHHLGGAAARVARDATAFSHRAAPFFINVIGHTDAAERFTAIRDWVCDLRAAFAAYSRMGMQPNFAGEPADLKAQAHDAATQSRLQGLRAHYDPEGLLAPLRPG